MLPKISVFVKSYDETICMYFLIEDDNLLEKYYKIWDKVSININKVFHSKPIYNEKYLKTKIKFYTGKTKINFMIMKYFKVFITIIYQ